jgi:DNA-directed RNA polymerase specialized sigma subunit
MEDAIKHFGLVMKIVKRYLKATDNPLDNDYWGDGLLGLAYALKTYDSTMNIKFSTYAYTCIYYELKNRFRIDRKTIKMESLNGVII